MRDTIPKLLLVRNLLTVQRHCGLDILGTSEKNAIVPVVRQEMSCLSSSIVRHRVSKPADISYNGNGSEECITDRFVISSVKLTIVSVTLFSFTFVLDYNCQRKQFSLIEYVSGQATSFATRRSVQTSRGRQSFTNHCQMT